MLHVVASREPLLVDLCARFQSNRGGIPGSHNISKANLLSTEPLEQDLILISQTGDPHSRIATELRDCGFYRRTEHLQGGLAAWLSSLLLLALDTMLQHGGTTLLIRATLPWSVLAGFSLVLHGGSRHLPRRDS